MKHLFVINPVAGGKDSTALVTGKVAAAFKDREGGYELYVTKGPRDAVAKIRADAQQADELRVYACGGDGTLCECVNGAALLPNVAVTHLPCGTGNDFIKIFGEGRERFSDVEELLNGELRTLDIIDCNGFFGVNICSVGIDARIGADVHKYSHLPVVGGSAGYVVSTAVNFFKGINDDMRIDCSGAAFSGPTAIVCVCNGRFYGGGFNPVPDAMPDDGVLDVLVAQHTNRIGVIKMIGGYAKGEYAKFPQYLTRVAATEVSVSCEHPLVVNIDGETIFDSEIKMKLVPSGVRFIIPKGLRISGE